MLGDETDDEGACKVWPENWPVVQLFIACRKQFATGPMGGITGFRAEGVAAVFRMRKVKRAEQAALFDDLQVMAGAAAEVLNATK